MFNSSTFDDLAARINKAIQSSPAKDIERNVKAMLQSGLSRLDVVPRREFDTQAQVLLRTRELVEALEARVAQLEATIAGAGATSGSATASGKRSHKGKSSQDAVPPDSTTPDL